MSYGRWIGVQRMRADASNVGIIGLAIQNPESFCIDFKYFFYEQISNTYSYKMRENLLVTHYYTVTSV
jgi:hypothetical protein